MTPAFGERFLTCPDFFPARLAGEPWGEGSATVRVASGDFAFLGLQPSQEEAVLRRFGPFARAGAEAAAVACRVLRVAPQEFRSFDPRGLELTLELRSSAQALLVAGVGLMARLEWRPSLRAGLWTAAVDGPELAGQIENVLRILAAYRLADAGGALLHSAGIVSGGEAWLFLGRSGAGKTTLARRSLDEGRAILSDDLNAVFPSEGSLWTEALPFAGDFGGRTPGAALRVRGICRLEKGPERRLEALSPGGAVATLLSCAPYVNQDASRTETVLGVFRNVAAGCPAYRLTLPREGRIFDLIEARARETVRA
jgi:hypothetical protein